MEILSAALSVYLTTPIDVFPRDGNLNVSTLFKTAVSAVFVN